MYLCLHLLPTRKEITQPQLQGSPYSPTSNSAPSASLPRPGSCLRPRRVQRTPAESRLERRIILAIQFVEQAVARGKHPHPHLPRRIRRDSCKLSNGSLATLPAANIRDNKARASRCNLAPRTPSSRPPRMHGEARTARSAWINAHRLPRGKCGACAWNSMKGTPAR